MRELQDNLRRAIVMLGIRGVRRGTAIAILGLSLLVGCGDDGEHSCNNTTHRCAKPEMPYCDLEGRFPESMGIQGVCIPDPYLDAGIDAGR